MKDTELRRSRDEAFYQTYLHGLRTQYFANMHEAADWCRFQPSPKFYISSRSLSNYLAILKAGGSLHCLHHFNKRKVLDLRERYDEYVNTHDVCGLGRERICEIIVEEQAPQYYISHDRAIAILKQQRAEHLR